MPTCTRCHGQVNVEDKACPHCGYTFVKSPRERWFAALMNVIKRNKYSTAGAFLGIVAVVCCIIAIGMGYFPFISYTRQSDEFATRIRLLGGGIGLLAMMASIIGFVKKEYRRLALAGIVLGISAIALKYAIIVLIIAIILIFLLRDYI